VQPQTQLLDLRPIRKLTSVIKLQGLPNIYNKLYNQKLMLSLQQICLLVDNHYAYLEL
jgi:hypothetical protein